MKSALVGFAAGIAGTFATMKLISAFGGEKDGKKDESSVESIERVDELSGVRQVWVKTLKCTRWLRLKQVGYILPANPEKVQGFEPDESNGCVIIPYVHTREFTEPGILLILSYRPPINRVCIEFPAGIKDPGETLETTAVRELKEETGFTGVLRPILGEPLLECYGEPYLNSHPGAMCVADIDADAPENSNPGQHLDETEDIRPMIVPLSELSVFLQQKRKEGYAVDIRVSTFALTQASLLKKGIEE